MQSSRATDPELMRRIAAGDETALATFYERFAPVLFSVIGTILRDERRAREVFQQAMMKMWKGATGYEPVRGSLFTWSVMIARHLAIERLGMRRETFAAANDEREAVKLAFFGKLPAAEAAEKIRSQIRLGLLGREAVQDRECEERAALYVLGLLGRQEAAVFEARLHREAELRALVDQLDERAAALAQDAPQHPVPPELRAEVLGQISDNRRGQFSLPRRSSWIPWAIAAAFALSCAYLVAERGTLRKRISHLEQRDLLSQIQIATLSSRLNSAPKANGVIVWDEGKQHGVLKLTEIPRNAPNQDYQLWMVDPRYKDPVSAGVFHVDNIGPLSVAFQPAAPVRGAKGFTISVERKGGVPKAAGPVVLLGK